MIFNVSLSSLRPGDFVVNAFNRHNADRKIGTFFVVSVTSLDAKYTGAIYSTQHTRLTILFVGDDKTGLQHMDFWSGASFNAIAIFRSARSCS
jgi:hypothetical protein